MKEGELGLLFGNPLFISMVGRDVALERDVPILADLVSAVAKRIRHIRTGGNLSSARSQCVDVHGLKKDSL